MTDVMMTVNHQRPVGAFMTALTRVEAKDRPKTVEALMTMLAAYLNAHFLVADKQPDVTSKAPDIKAAGPGPDEAKARFVANTAGQDDKDTAIGRWMVHPYMEIAHVKRNAKLDLRQHTASEVVIRLPQTQLLADAEVEARTLSIAGDTDKFTGPSYYYTYFTKTSDITSMEYLWSRIADYTTASCR